MKLTILGTGNATVSEYYNTCYAISDEGKHFLVDAGGGNRILKVLKDTGIDMNDIHDIFVTHEHVDHVLGIIWLVRMIGQRMNQGKYEGDLRIYCHEELADLPHVLYTPRYSGSGIQCTQRLSQKVTENVEKFLEEHK